MSPAQPKLLAVVEFMEHARLPALYADCGYAVSTEWSVRKAVTLLGRLKPAVVVADFYAQSDFRDRVSNVESLLATAQPLGTRILLLHRAEDGAALERVGGRLRIDAAFPMPADEAALAAQLRQWHDEFIKEK